MAQTARGYPTSRAGDFQSPANDNRPPAKVYEFPRRPPAVPAPANDNRPGQPRPVKPGRSRFPDIGLPRLADATRGLLRGNPALRAAETALQLIELASPNAFNAFGVWHKGNYQKCFGPCPDGKPVNWVATVPSQLVCPSTTCGVLQSIVGGTHAYKWNAEKESFADARAITTWFRYEVAPGIFRGNQHENWLRIIGPGQRPRPYIAPGHYNERAPMPFRLTTVGKIVNPAWREQPKPRQKRLEWPKRKADERKKGLAQKGYALAAGVWDKADEAQQILDIVWKSLPAKYRGKDTTMGGKARAIWQHASHIHLPTMLADLLVNQVEDKAVGSFHGAVRKGQTNAQAHGFSHNRPGFGSGPGF